MSEYLKIKYLDKGDLRYISYYLGLENFKIKYINNSNLYLVINSPNGSWASLRTVDRRFKRRYNKLRTFYAKDFNANRILFLHVLISLGKFSGI
jgi:hypothetical protein